MNEEERKLMTPSEVRTVELMRRHLWHSGCSVCSKIADHLKDQDELLARVEAIIESHEYKEGTWFSSDLNHKLWVILKEVQALRAIRDDKHE
jgi:hypothetical protein